MRRWLWGGAGLALVLSLQWWRLGSEQTPGPSPADANDADASTLRPPLLRSMQRGPDASEVDADFDDPYAFTEMRGRVVDKDTKLGVSNATVRVLHHRAQLRETRTGPGGGFSFEGLSPGAYRFEVEANGFLGASLELRKLNVLEDDEDILITLESAVRLEGEVLGPEGRAIEGAIVAIERRESTTHGEPFLVRETNQDGRFEFEAAPRDELVISAHHPHFGSVDEILEPRTEQSARLVLRLETGRRITGRVRGPSGPLSEALVWPSPPGPFNYQPDSAVLRRYAVTTDLEGRYELVVRATTSGVVAWAEGHRSEIKWVGPEVSETNFELTTSATLIVSVLDGAGGPVSDVRVSVEDGVFGVSETVTDSNGVVVFRNLVPGDVGVRLRTVEGQDRTERTTLLEGRENEIQISLGGAAGIRGHLENAATGDRITQMFLMLAREDASFAQRVKSPSGQFVFEGLRPGPWTLFIQSPGFVHHRIEGLQVSEGMTTLGAIQLEPLARIEGRVSPAPSEALLIGEAIAQPSGQSTSFVVEPDGQFMVELRAGSYAVEFRDGEERIRAARHWHVRSGEIMAGIQIELREF